MIALISSRNRSKVVSNISLYSDGTPFIKDNDILWYADTMVLTDPTLSHFSTAMMVADAIAAQVGPLETLMIPYLPGARQDRQNRGGDMLFGADYFAREINARGFEHVLAVDPHSHVMPEMINGFVEYPLERVYGKLWNGYTGVIAPDHGSHDRAMTAALALRKPLIYGDKVRDPETGRLSGFKVEELEAGGHYIVVDDICDGGGTFVGLGEKIAQQDCWADLFVTHGIFTRGTSELNKFYKNIYSTDTRRFNELARVHKVNIIDDMIEYATSL